MCQLIEVTWFIWKLSADQLIILLDRDQCSVSYFLASLGSEHRKTDTHIGHQCCDPLTAVKTRYPLTSITWPYRGLRCRPIEVKCFLKLSADKVLVSKWSQAQVYFFFKFIWHMLCLCSAQLKFWFHTNLGLESSDAKIQPAATGREDSCFWLFSPCSRVGHALRPIFMLWLVKIWQVSSCGKFMQHLESCLLWQLKLTEFCVNLLCF